jgi:hypothetical protein
LIHSTYHAFLRNDLAVSNKIEAEGKERLSPSLLSEVIGGTCWGLFGAENIRDSLTFSIFTSFAMKPPIVDLYSHSPRNAALIITNTQT